MASSFDTRADDVRDAACPVPPNVAFRATQLLHRSGYPQLRLISCEFDNGVLVLRGQVGSYYMKQLAQTIVRGLAEVDRIDNLLHVH